MPRHSRTGAVDRPGDRLVGAAKRGKCQHAEHRIEEPPAGMAAQLLPGRSDHPDDEGEYRQWPYPADDIQRPGVRCEDDEASAKEAHERGRDGCPSLRLVRPKRGEQCEQRPTKGEGEQHRTSNHVFLRPPQRADNQHNRGNQPA